MAGGRRKTTAGARVGANKAARTQAEPATAEELKTAQMLRTIDELKAQCLAFGLSQDGRKSTLVGRVVRHMRAAATATPGIGAGATTETAVVGTADALAADLEAGKDADEGDLDDAGIDWKRQAEAAQKAAEEAQRELAQLKAATAGDTHAKRQELRQEMSKLSVSALRAKAKESATTEAIASAMDARDVKAALIDVLVTARTVDATPSREELEKKQLSELLQIAEDNGASDDLISTALDDSVPVQAVIALFLSGAIPWSEGNKRKVPAESKPDDDAGAGDYLRSMRAQMQALEQAARTAASPQQREQLTKTAAVMRVELEAQQRQHAQAALHVPRRGAQRAVRSPSKTEVRGMSTGELQTLQHDLLAAIKAKDQTKVKELVEAMDVEVQSGGSPTMNELALAGQQPGEAGTHPPPAPYMLSLVEQPGRDYRGRRPRVVKALQEGDRKNLYLPQYFVHGATRSLEDEFSGAESRGYTEQPDGTLKAAAGKSTLAQLTSSDMFGECAGHLGLHAMACTPPLMSPAEAVDHASYVLNRQKSMRSTGADTKASIMRLHLIFDQRFREDVYFGRFEDGWRAAAASLKEELIDTPLQDLNEKRIAALEKERSRGGGDGGGGGGNNKNKSKIEKAKDWFMATYPTGDPKWQKKGTKFICHNFNKRVGCSRTNCIFSHHCAKCGAADHGVHENKC